ncbi:MAG: translational GTPase TypA [Gammaproteobacteria bacterium]|jgi:GTP-binding protein|nr:translational GTPase TypA [Gammaproteobacteria bacterium]
MRPIRNIAIIAHVDHGKTTLVDCLLKQSGTFASHEKMGERIMDSNALERERGITILAKNCAIDFGGTRINIVDTPGHADFGGEVERVLSMVDGVLLLVDAVEGPMPQTRFVTRKALALGHRAIVVINKVDRPGSRPNWVIDRTFELFDKLGATDAQLDFPIIYASALQGWATHDLEQPATDMSALFEAILTHVPSPPSELDAPLQLQISQLDYNSYVGRIGIGRIRQGHLKTGRNVALRYGDESRGTGRIGQILSFRGLERFAVDEASAGDIVAVTGIDEVNIGVTLCDLENPQPLPPIAVDEPTLSMTFQVNTSPLAGREGKFVTSRQIRERLQRELQSNVALRVEDTGDADVFRVSGRGELHLTILIENMRREGFELAVGKPQVLRRMIGGVSQEPFEALTIDIDEGLQGPIMAELGERKGELLDMVIEGDPTGRGQGRVRLEYRIPARGLIGFQGEFLTLTRGTGLMSHIFDGYDVVKGEIPERHNGVLISNENGEAVAYSLFSLQERGRLFVGHGTKVYEGMIIGIHSRDNDLVVNPIKEKKLSNVRASGKDEALILVPPIPLTLEYAVEFINDDELVEVTPESIRLRKKFLKEHERRRASRDSDD